MTTQRKRFPTCGTGLIEAPRLPPSSSTFPSIPLGDSFASLRWFVTLLCFVDASHHSYHKESSFYGICHCIGRLMNSLIVPCRVNVPVNQVYVHSIVCVPSYASTSLAQPQTSFFLRWFKNAVFTSPVSTKEVLLPLSLSQGSMRRLVQWFSIPHQWYTAYEKTSMGSGHAKVILTGKRFDPCSRALVTK